MRRQSLGNLECLSSSFVFLLGRSILLFPYPALRLFSPSLVLFISSDPLPLQPPPYLLARFAIRFLSTRFARSLRTREDQYSLMLVDYRTVLLWMTTFAVKEAGRQPPSLSLEGLKKQVESKSTYQHY